MQWMYAYYLKRENNPNKKWNIVFMSLQNTTLALLASRSTDWANGPLIIIKNNNLNVQYIALFQYWSKLLYKL